jgi:hypothetical protein
MRLLSSDQPIASKGPVKNAPSSEQWVALTFGVSLMCRNIKTLFNFEPPVTDDEIRAAALQFVRKVSGFNKPSKINEAVFLAAVDDVATVARNLLSSLQTNAPPRNRAEETFKTRARAAKRFPT